MSENVKKENSKNGGAEELVLIAIDESSAVPLIVDFVTKHNWSSATRFKVIHAIAPIMMDHPMASYPLFLESLEKDVRQYAENLVARVKADMQKSLAAHQIDTEVICGLPAEIILDEAKSSHASMIVVGSHGRTGFTRFFLGSVSGAVVSHAPCNVMIVRVPKQQASDKTDLTSKAMSAAAP